MGHLLDDKAREMFNQVKTVGVVESCSVLVVILIPVKIYFNGDMSYDNTIDIAPVPGKINYTEDALIDVVYISDVPISDLYDSLLTILSIGIESF
jgi:hypothetical protein